MGTPTQLEGPSRVDKSHKAALSDIVVTDRDPRSKNLPISRDRSYQNAIMLARYDSAELGPQSGSACPIFIYMLCLCLIDAL